MGFWQEVEDERIVRFYLDEMNLSKSPCFQGQIWKWNGINYHILEDSSPNASHVKCMCFIEHNGYTVVEKRSVSKAIVMRSLIKNA